MLARQSISRVGGAFTGDRMKRLPPAKNRGTGLHQIPAGSPRRLFHAIPGKGSRQLTGSFGVAPKKAGQCGRQSSELEFPGDHRKTPGAGKISEDVNTFERNS